MKENDISEKLNHLDHNNLRKVLTMVLSKYSNPSFGSMSKHDTDLLLFEAMINLGIIKNNPSIYEVMRDLTVTRTKARNLIYEYQLRRFKNEEDLRQQLCVVLKSPLISLASDNVCLEIDNPYLVDYLRNELKGLGYVTDGSFHAELVKISTEAYTNLYEKMLSDQSKKEIRQHLVKLGIKKDVSLPKLFTSVISGIAKTAAQKTMGKIGEDMIEECFKYLNQNIEMFKQDFGGYFN